MRITFAPLLAVLAAAAPLGAAAQDATGLRTSLPPDDAAVAEAYPNAPRRTIAPEDDPYAPLGIRVGRYILYSSLTSTLGHTSNADGVAGGKGAGYGILAPELRLESDWDRHAATLTLRGEYEQYFDGSDASPAAEIAATRRIDFADRWTADLAAGYRYEQQDTTDPDFPAGADSPPGIHDLTASAALSGGAGRATFTFEGRVDRQMFEDASSGGVPIDQGDRTSTLVSARLRAGYEATATLTPFVEGVVSRRLYDRAVDNDGLRRSSTGLAWRAGIAFDRDPILSGEVAVGAAQEVFDDAALATLRTLTFDGSLMWAPTPLTTVKLDGTTAFNPSADVASAGSVVHEVTVNVDYAWRRNVTLNANAGFVREAYEGTGVVDTTTSAGFGATWKVNRTMHLTAGYLHEWADSTDPTGRYQSDAVQLQLRLQR